MSVNQGLDRPFDSIDVEIEHGDRDIGEWEALDLSIHFGPDLSDLRS